MPKTLDQVSAAFARIYGDSRPIRGRDELDAAVRAGGLRYDDVTDQWLQSLKTAWVYMQSDEPFDDDRANRAYKRELRVF